MSSYTNLELPEKLYSPKTARIMGIIVALVFLGPAVYFGIENLLLFSLITLVFVLINSIPFFFGNTWKITLPVCIDICLIPVLVSLAHRPNYTATAVLFFIFTGVACPFGIIKGKEEVEKKAFKILANKLEEYGLLEYPIFKWGLIKNLAFDVYRERRSDDELKLAYFRRIQNEKIIPDGFFVDIEGYFLRPTEEK